MTSPPLPEQHHSDARFQGLLESAPDGVVVVDGAGRIVIVNSQAEKMFAWRREELVGQPVEVLVPQRYQASHRAVREGYSHRARVRPMGASRPLVGRRKDGAEFPVEISLSPLQTEQGQLVISIVRDITDRRQAEEQLKASLREKEVLLKEIHHRVKNNLQVTSSLLKLQSAHIQDPRARELIAESQNRIRSMALVHEKLYQTRDLSRVDLAEYTRSLGALLFRSFGVDPERIALTVEGDRAVLSVEAAVPCGLILNELLSNCLKHAFPAGRRGQIVVGVREGAAGSLAISVRDDGVGLPPGVEPERTETLGLQLVRTLATQLRAEVEVRRSAGTEFRIVFTEAKR